MCLRWLAPRSNYRRTSNLRRTKSQNLNVVSSWSCLCSVHWNQELSWYMYPRKLIEFKANRNIFATSVEMFYCIIKIELLFNAYKFSSLQLDFHATMLSAPFTHHSTWSRFHNPHLEMNEFVHTLAVLVVCQTHVISKLYGDVIMRAMTSQITSLTIICSTVYSGADQRKHHSSASLALVWGIHRWPVNSPHKGPAMRKMYPFDDAIMKIWLIELRYLMQFIQYTTLFCCV